MSSTRRHEPLFRGLLLVSALLCAISSAAEQGADDRAPLVVASLEGDVHAHTNNHDVLLKVGGTLALPISLQVGADGAIELHQGLTVISAAANSRLDIPKSNDASQTLEKVMQTQGNVYYNVAKRPTHKLNIETPFLVAVIKGTRFNVSATEKAATVSLLEGSIEIKGGTGEPIDLQAGQMATGTRGRPVQVMQMTTGDIIRRTSGPGTQVVKVRSNPWDQHAETATPSSSTPSSTASAATSVAVASEVRSPTSITAISNTPTVRADDHGAGNSLALNQLLTQTAAESSHTTTGSSAGAESQSSGSGSANTAPSSGSFGTGSGPASGGGSSTGPAATGNGNPSTGANTGGTAASPTGGSGTGSNVNNSGGGNGASGSNSASSNTASGSNGGSGNTASGGNSSSGAQVTGNGSGNANSNGSGNSNSNGSGNSNGKGSGSGSGGGKGGSGPDAGNSNSQGNDGNHTGQGNGNENGNNSDKGTGDGSKTPGNSGHAITPGSGPATTGASGKPTPDDSLISDLESLLNSKTSPLKKKK
jgi:FecR protein